MLFLGWYSYKNNWKTQKTLSLGVTLAFAGCVGNLIDRLISIIPPLAEGREGVVDMISLEPLNALSRLISGSDFPVFNLADSFLVVGVILIAIDMLFFEEKRKKNNEISN
jgi:signal peptidase II